MKPLFVLIISALFFISCNNESVEFNSIKSTDNVTELHDSGYESQDGVKKPENGDINPETPVTASEPVAESDEEPVKESPTNGENNQGGSTNTETGTSPEPHPDETEPSEQPDEPTEPLEPPVEDDEHAGAVALEAEGLTNFYRVSEDLYRSGQPEKGGLVSARDLGIKTVLSLQLLPFDAVLEETELSGLRLEHIPMVPSAVSEEDVVKALKVIQTAEKPVLVHCLHGSDRTGTVVAMYRIVFENWTKEEAKAEMTDERFGYHTEFENLLTLIDSFDVDELRAKVMNE